MSNKFDSVPVEKDTKILTSLQVKFGEFDVLYQKWQWDGITAESLIFLSEHMPQMSDDALAEEVKSSPLVKPDSQVTIKRANSGFTFVNFNFDV